MSFLVGGGIPNLGRSILKDLLNSIGGQKMIGPQEF